MRAFRGFNRRGSGKPKTLVTYYVDTGVTYAEKVKQGDSVLSPSFTPTKTGYTFHGWREDDTASSTVLSTKTAEGATMSLYAVFKNSITLSYDGNGETSGSMSSQSDYGYYNNANEIGATFTTQVNAFVKTNQSFYAYRLNDATTGDRQREEASLTITADGTLYVEWVTATLEVVNDSNYVTGTKVIEGWSPWGGWGGTHYGYWNLLSKGAYQTATAYAYAYFTNSDGNAETGYLKIGQAGIDSTTNIVANANNPPPGQARTFYGSLQINVGQHYIYGDAKSYDNYTQGVRVVLYSVVLSNPTKW